MFIEIDNCFKIKKNLGRILKTYLEIIKKEEKLKNNNHNHFF